MIKKIVLLLLVFGIFASSIPVDVKAADTDGCTAVLGTTQKIKHGKNKYCKKFRIKKSPSSKHC